jgi:hypothetical protein
VFLRITFAAAALGCLCPLARAGSPAQPAAKPAPHRLWYDALFLQPLLERSGPPVAKPESVQMLSALFRGSMMGPGDGWFGPSRLRYGWSWFSARYDADKDGRVTRKEFPGPAELFDRLDRDRDGAVTAADFDWSANAAFLRQTDAIGQWFAGMDTDSNGRLSRKEWQAFFDKLAKGKDHVTPEDLRQALYKPPRPPSKPPKGKAEKMRETLFWNLLKGDLGSPYEGPRVGEPAPDFTLPTHDGKKKVTLSKFHGHKPVVLIFGNFT